jgi:AraC family transcriptional activator of pobA
MKAVKNILHFDGLYGDDQSKYSAEYIFLELISTRSQSFDWVVKPHLHSSLFQVFMLEKGKVTFQSSNDTVEMTSPCIIFVPPTQVHGLEYTPDVEGYILTVSASIIDDIFKTSLEIYSFFDKINIASRLDEENIFSKIKNLIKELENELFSDEPERSILIKSLLTQYFIQLYRICDKNENKDVNNRYLGYFRKFQKAIKSSDYTKTIPQYASELNITLAHLNRICKSIVGKSAIEIVHQHINTEAQKYLIHTSYSVSEIAYQLNFEYPNYFSRFFKKYNGVSPQEYRMHDRS